ncbi:probable cytochrome P450 304a1 [Schistocerca piceifrons]|uniref:probable cytochrome P450 304a1 n=1 Tax=Schistocerca piceifrons TaxID=274613 RepID=UPI001F5E5D6A|nr:probable cytochrome P450 304a1 [Schistocerca piceifrons]
MQGLPGLPIWGSYIQLLLENYKFPYKVMDVFTGRYNSKLVGFYFGPLPLVVTSDYEAAKEAFNNPSLQGRISNIAIKQRMPNEDLGINFRVGPELMEQRRFTLRYLRDFGFGRRSDHLESEIEAEMMELVELIRGERKDEAVVQPPSGGDGSLHVLLPDTLFPGFINGFMSVVAGSRLPQTADGVCRYLGHTGLQTARVGDATGGFLTLHSALASIAPKMSAYHDMVESAEKILIYFHQVIEQHEKTYSDDHMRDFIDRYLREIRDKQKTGVEAIYSRKRLCPGETFARQNMFLMLAALLQSFSVRADGLPPLHCNIPEAIETLSAFWAQLEIQ